MVLPLIPAGIAVAAESEVVIAAGATATAFVYAKRHELARGLVRGAEAVADAIRSIPNPWADGYTDTRPETLLPALPHATPSTGETTVTRLPTTAAPMPQPSGEPPDVGSVIRKLQESGRKAAQTVGRWVQRPGVQRTLTAIQWITLGNGVVSVADIAYRKATGDTNTHPTLYSAYEYLFKDRLGESRSLRAALGFYQCVSIGVLVSRLPILRTMPFWPTVAYETIGQTSGIVHQTRATGVAPADMDFVALSQASVAYGFLSYGTIAIASGVSRYFGSVPLNTWLMHNRNSGSAPHVNRLLVGAWDAFVQRLPTLAKIVKPDHLPRWQSVAGFALGFLGYGALAQLAISPWIEDSDVEQSIYQSSARRGLGLPFDIYFMLMFDLKRRVPALFVLLDNVVFNTTMAITDDHFSAWDGRPLAVKTAAEKIAASRTLRDLLKVLREAPFTNKNWLGPRAYDVSSKTWAALAHDLKLSKYSRILLREAEEVLRQSPEPADRQLAEAIRTLL